MVPIGTDATDSHMLCINLQMGARAIDVKFYPRCLQWFLKGPQGFYTVFSATQWNNGKNMSEEKLADLCAKSERFIGTQGGGMDQAIEILARSGKAKLIEFNPLRTFDVELPDGAVFVIANSLAESNKAAGSDFNTRVAECKMATKVLGKALGVPDMTRLGDLQKASGLSLRQMIEKVDSVLKPGTYSKQEIIDAVGVPEHELDATCLSANTLDMKEFRLRDRAMHVFSGKWRF